MPITPDAIDASDQRSAFRLAGRLHLRRQTRFLTMRESLGVMLSPTTISFLFFIRSAISSIRLSYSAALRISSDASMLFSILRDVSILSCFDIDI